MHHCDNTLHCLVLNNQSKHKEVHETIHVIQCYGVIRRQYI